MISKRKNLRSVGGLLDGKDDADIGDKLISQTKAGKFRYSLRDA